MLQVNYAYVVQDLHDDRGLDLVTAVGDGVLFEQTPEELARYLGTIPPDMTVWVGPGVLGRADGEVVTAADLASELSPEAVT